MSRSGRKRVLLYALSLNYFPKTFSAVPRSLKFGFPIALPVSSLTFPTASLAEERCQVRVLKIGEQY